MQLTKYSNYHTKMVRQGEVLNLRSQTNWKQKDVEWYTMQTATNSSNTKAILC